MSDINDPDLEFDKKYQLFERIYSSKDKVGYGLSLVFYALLEWLFDELKLPSKIPSGFIALLLGMIFGDIFASLLTRAKDGILKSSLFKEDTKFIKKKYMELNALLDQEISQYEDSEANPDATAKEYIESLRAKKRELFTTMLTEIQALPAPHTLGKEPPK